MKVNHINSSWKITHLKRAKLNLHKSINKTSNKDKFKNKNNNKNKKKVKDKLNIHKLIRGNVNKMMSNTNKKKINKSHRKNHVVILS
jgi:hypothetical protein